MTIAARISRGTLFCCTALALAGALVGGGWLGAERAEAARGGLSALAPPPEAAPAPAPEGEPGLAAFSAGRALAPVDAPPAVRKAIAYANRIRTKPYIWGGGHRRWWDRGYDCSGAVSYALRGAGLLARPLDSGSLMRWGEAGPGRWISVYANRGHAFVVIAGLRFDTSGGGSSGPRWRPGSFESDGFVVRHPPGY